MIGVLVTLIMAVVIGAIGSALAPGAMPGGIIGAMIAGFVGAWIGAWLFRQLGIGDLGLVIGGFAVIPAIIGAALFVFLLGLVARGMSRNAA
ncbi:Transglycosylase associated protein [Paenibacillus sp. UNCCL117]|uniref:GlsB/YeaQ/YmgE family stress response membrane protein n=1 Tax=unclassified Paenibacillus TaxID=185978 RepID=UPI00088600F5|nr:MULTISPECIES: GlsB/YeaQ/YmgE family stress response membrane protein [unclassified Paenibacillus]SDE07669.1 Transglycosylase associated protein [Paenibacillus sp. cl123]SFW59123.1 Transglycosylase associated protein [Paenibacillus sp. UNCCL117]